MFSKLWLFCFLALLTTTTHVNAKSIAELQAIQKLPNNKLKLRAFEQIDPTSLTDQIAACEYYVSYSKALSNEGRSDEAKQRLLNEINSPSFDYNHRWTARLYKDLADIQYHNYDYEDARETIKKAIYHYKKSGNIEFLTHGIVRQASIELRTSHYLKGINIVKTYQKEYQSWLTEKDLSSLFYFYGRAYDHLGEFQTALEFKIKAFEIDKKLNAADKRMANSLFGIADSYNKIGEHQLSYNKFLEALALDRKSDNKQDIGHSLAKLSFQSYKLKHFDLGIEHAEEAISVFRYIKHQRNTAWSKHNLALNYAGKGEIQKAIILEEENYSFLDKTKKDYQLKTSVWNHLAELNLAIDNPKKALSYAKKAFEFGDVDTLKDRRQASLRIMHRAYSIMKDFENAYLVQNKLLELQSISHKENYANRLAFLQNTIEAKEKEQKLAEKEQENLLISNALAHQQNQQMVFIILFIVFVSFTMIIYIKIRQNRVLEQQQRLHLNKLLEQRNQLFSQIAHDLSNPVTIASLHIEAMQHRIIECKPENLTKISEKLTDLNHLVKDLAGLAKLETANFTLSTQQTDLNKFVSDIHDELATQTTEQKLTIGANKFNETFAHIDPFRVKQLIANLYSNAKKYTHKDGEIDVHFAACEHYFKIIVQDSAPSVPKEHLGQIFDHLFRVPNMSNTETPGHGIGLSIVKQIVDLHQGEINASESELGGLKIEVDLPLK
ncbi:tetratricopeptide repeat-containing sensor histidine kinase [Pseudoalteromonas sp. BZB3]|uniref:tetratricopeptide repeat-containing sensor histidine kinase n=1 Tax=Pseudoalteromonas sp. BZB3 TaxID=3136670 RepID=UPI0032C3FDE9